MSDGNRQHTTDRGGWLGIGAVALIACCVVPTLVAAGALATVGAFVVNPVIAIAGIALAVIALFCLIRGW